MSRVIVCSLVAIMLTGCASKSETKVAVEVANLDTPKSGTYLVKPRASSMASRLNHIRIGSHL